MCCKGRLHEVWQNPSHYQPYRHSSGIISSKCFCSTACRNSKSRFQPVWHLVSQELGPKPCNPPCAAPASFGSGTLRRDSFRTLFSLRSGLKGLGDPCAAGRVATQTFKGWLPVGLSDSFCFLDQGWERGKRIGTL